MSDNPLRQHINDLATPINPAPVVDDRTYSQSLEDRAVARRAAQANAQALSERDAELVHAAPAAAALHAYAAAWLARADFDTVFELHEALLDTHRATTPSEVPSSHVIVERAELERLRAVNAAAVAWQRAWYAPGEGSTGDPEQDALIFALLGEDA